MEEIGSQVYNSHLLSLDLAEISTPIAELLEENGNCNTKGVAALLQLASCMIAEMSGGIPSDEDHRLATEAINLMHGNPRALISVLANVGLAFAMNHYGLMKGAPRNGSV